MLAIFSNYTVNNSSEKTLVALICRQIYPYSTGGAEIHCYYVASELAKHHGVLLITDKPDEKKTKNNTQKLVFNALQMVSFLLKSSAYIILNHNKIRLMHAQVALSPAILCLVINKISGIPFIVTCHGSEVRLQKNKFIRMLQRQAFINASQITSVSSEIRKILVEKYGVEPCKISVIPNGYNSNLPLASKVKKVDKSNEYIIFVGRLSYPKDPETLLSAFEMVHKVHPKVNLCFVGEGKLRSRLENFSRKHNLSESVEFKGKISHNETLNLISNSSIFVISSLEEGLPNVLVEAMACGKPVIASNVGGIPELIVNNVNGILVPSQSVESMAKSIEQLLSNSQLQMKMGQAALRSVKDYSWSKIAEDYQKIYDKCTA
jgi:glycosyltransferase involved in cell wall biosynthesis